MSSGGEPAPIRVFYSYSHKDEELRLKLEDHLAFLRWSGKISEWNDRDIDVGQEWEKEIDRNLSSADIILLLVSASFIASKYCWSVEVKKALDRHDRGEAKVIPVILRPCRWTATPFAKLQAAPKHAKPVSLWADVDEAFHDVVSKIEHVVTDLQRKRAAVATPVPIAPTPPSTPKPAGAGIGAASTPSPLQPGPRPRAGEGGTRDRGRVRAKQRPAPKDGIYIGADRRELSDFAVFRDVPLPWCPEMVVIPAGQFLMGSPPDEKDRYSDESPPHCVVIGYRFAIGRYPVTFAEYDHFCEVTRREKPPDQAWGRGRRPVINVSWRDAQAYCEWLANETSQSYRLPSEAEWEYACRAGTTMRYAFGGAITSRDANYNQGKLHKTTEVGAGYQRKTTADRDLYDDHGYPGQTTDYRGLYDDHDYRGKTTEVGAYRPNSWGIYDMHGNVWEWVEDVWHDSYKGAPIDGSAWTDGKGPRSYCSRLRRGGSWDDLPSYLRSASRNWDHPGHRYGNLGFRVARTLD